jgi:hypothetical protein
MAQVTVTLTDADAAQLAALASRHGTTPEEVASHVVARELSKAFRVRDAKDGGQEQARTRSKLQQRMFRQLALIRHLEQHGWPDTSEDKGALARQLDITERTLYRYLDVVGPVAGVARPVKEPPPPKPKPARKPRRKRSRQGSPDAKVSAGDITPRARD